jgi:hypothetical protein
MHSKARDVSQFCVFGCRAWVYLNSNTREKGKHMDRAVEAINLGFKFKLTLSLFWKRIISWHLTNESLINVFPFCKKKMVEQ